MKAKFDGVAPLLQVYDMPVAVRFYCGVLSFALLERSGEGDEFDWCLLAGGGAEIMLNAMYEAGERPAAPDLARAAAHADTCLFFACRDLDAAYDELQAHGVTAAPPRVTPYGMRQLSFRDPDGYGLCFQWPADERWAETWRKRCGTEA